MRVKGHQGMFGREERFVVRKSFGPASTILKSSGHRMMGDGRMSLDR